MGRIPILFRDRSYFDKHPEIPGKFQSLARSLPIFYMSDHSVLGLLVDMPDEAVRILGENGFVVTDEDCGVEVAIEQPSHLSAIVQLLKTHGIGCEIADVVDQVYRG